MTLAVEKIFDYKIDESKLSENELIIHQARKDVDVGKITVEEFSKVKMKYGSHKKFTLEEYLNLPIVTDADGKEGMYRLQEDKMKIPWTGVFVIKPTEEVNKVNMEFEMCEIIDD